jgi:hypothetical protein
VTAVYRHFAFFDVAGRWTREWAGPVPAPDLDESGARDVRTAALIAWATRVAPPHPGEQGLDVTPCGYPVGDFVWARWNSVDRILDFPVMHRFVLIDRESGWIAANHESGRPVRGNDRHVVVDITGTALEDDFGCIFGRLRRHRSRWILDGRSPLPASQGDVLVRLLLAQSPVPVAMPVGRVFAVAGRVR